MKKFILLIATLFCCLQAKAAFLTYTWSSTNTPSVTTNIAKSLATNVVQQNIGGILGYQTNIFTTNTSANISNLVNVIAASTVTNVYEFTLSDEVNALSTGTKFTWRSPWAITLKDVRASVTTASSSGLPTFNILEGGVTIFSTKLTIDANELTSVTAATPYVFSDTSIANDASVTFTIDVAGTGTAGAKVKIYYTIP